MLKKWVGLGVLLSLGAGAFSDGAFAQPGKSAFWREENLGSTKNAFFPPLFSYILPGFDQWLEWQVPYAASYSLLGIAGYATMFSASTKTQKFADLGSRDHGIRTYLLGNSMLSTASGLSAYHSFRTAVHTQWKEENFKFLKPEMEGEPQDLAIAPFKVGYFLQLSTFIPLGIAAGFLYLDFKSASTHWHGFRGDDLAYAGAFSYGAGVGEESLFRGFLMPWTQDVVHAEWASNLLTASVFAAAHISSDYKVPIAQFLLGYYLGYVTQKNDWTISESIFIHTWWDIFAFAGSYATTGKANLKLDLLNLRF